MASEIKVDTISEKTSAGGVTIDGLLIKDGGISGDVSLIGTTPTFTIGDAGAEDAALVFDGNAQDFYIALDDSADDLVIGLGSTVGTTPAISINSDRDVTISDGAIDFDVASHDGTNGLKLAGTLVTTTAAEMNLLDGGTSVGSSITIADADGFVVNDGGTMKTIPATDIPTYVGGGITEIDQWRLTSSLQIGTSETAITANLERVDAPTIHTGNLGTGMSESSGIFSFPSTGWWEVTFNVRFDLPSGGDDRGLHAFINVTDDNSGYKYIGYQSESIHNETGDGANAHISHSVVLDIESTTNDKVKFAISSINGAAAAQGQTGYSRTYMKFIKLADT